MNSASACTQSGDPLPVVLLGPTAHNCTTLISTTGPANRSQTNAVLSQPSELTDRRGTLTPRFSRTRTPEDRTAEPNNIRHARSPVWSVGTSDWRARVEHSWRHETWAADCASRRGWCRSGCGLGFVQGPALARQLLHPRDETAFQAHVSTYIAGWGSEEDPLGPTRDQAWADSNPEALLIAGDRACSWLAAQPSAPELDPTGNSTFDHLATQYVGARGTPDTQPDTDPMRHRSAMKFPPSAGSRSWPLPGNTCAGQPRMIA